MGQIHVLDTIYFPLKIVTFYGFIGLNIDRVPLELRSTKTDMDHYYCTERKGKRCSSKSGPVAKSSEKKPTHSLSYFTNRKYNHKIFFMKLNIRTKFNNSQ